MKKYRIFFVAFSLIITIFLLHSCSSSTSVNPLIAMVSVPGGTFDMGWNFTGMTDYSEPIHSVTLSGFSIGKYEITNAEVVSVFNWANDNGKFATVNSTTVTNKGDSQELLDLDETSHHITFNESDGIFSVTTGLGEDGSGGSVDLSNYPIFFISWYGAAAFCNYLSEREGLTPCYNLTDWSCDFNANGYRLPTEAEWEYAARYINGTDFYDGDWFSSGPAGYQANILSWNSDNADTPPHCNINTGVRGTHEVGTKSPNYLGIYDMTGNVDEWCNDWDDYYEEGAATDPTGPSSGTDRIYRGGSIGCNPIIIDSGLETSTRRMWSPDWLYFDLGFRIVRRS
jgi:sulfatase modifying factor 1